MLKYNFNKQAPEFNLVLLNPLFANKLQGSHVVILKKVLLKVAIMLHRQPRCQTLLL